MMRAACLLSDCCVRLAAKSEMPSESWKLSEGIIKLFIKLLVAPTTISFLILAIGTGTAVSLLFFVYFQNSYQFVAGVEDVQVIAAGCQILQRYFADIPVNLDFPDVAAEEVG